MVPGDGHVHTQWSWDAPHGSMEDACARAVELGVDSVAFTDHADFISWRVSAGTAAFFEALGGRVSDGVFTPPALDVDGYLASVEACRERFPNLEIRTAVELGEPHWHRREATALLRRGNFDSIVVALHSLPDGRGGYVEVSDAYLERAAPDVVRAYLAELEAMIGQWDEFDTLAHIDYPVRAWPEGAGPYRTHEFEGEYRAVLATLARSGRALEVNTRLPLDPALIAWWREAGGAALTFGSDVHDPHHVAQGFSDAVEVSSGCGYGPQPGRRDQWSLTEPRP